MAKKKRPVGRPPGQRKDGQYVTMLLSRASLQDIEAYRERLRLPSRTAAVERLAAEAAR